jgi:hypothetical protein
VVSAVSMASMRRPMSRFMRSLSSRVVVFSLATALGPPFISRRT